MNIGYKFLCLLILTLLSFSSVHAVRGDILFINKTTPVTPSGSSKSIQLNEGFIVVESQRMNNNIEVILTDGKVTSIPSSSVYNGYPEDVIPWNSGYMVTASSLYQKNTNQFSKIGDLATYDAFVIKGITPVLNDFIKVQMLSGDSAGQTGYIQIIQSQLTCVSNKKYNILRGFFSLHPAYLGFFSEYCSVGELGIYFPKPQTAKQYTIVN